MGDTEHPRADEPTFQDRFARIEAAVDAGDTDLSRLGFWRLLREVKSDPILSAHWADAAGRIDGAAFTARVRTRFPIWLGNLVLVLATTFGALAVVVAMNASDPTVAGIALVFAGVVWSVSLHDLAHWVVGRAAGIRFTAYFLAGFPPRPGMKIDYATYLRASPTARAWMHASGALATKVAPFVALGFWWATDAPGWAAWVLLAWGIFQIVTDVLFSTKSSDWKKVNRERRIARAQPAR
jgi:hypothetical protein